MNLVIGGFMEITWYGHACFRITERGLATVVTDPFDSKVIGYEPLKLKADILTVSQNTPGHNHIGSVKGEPYTITGPGEFEIGSVFITGVQTNGHSKKETDPRNTLFVFDYNNITVAHLGNINRVPTQTEIEALGNVKIALVPVGGSFASEKLSEVLSMLEPNIIIPMMYKTSGSQTSLDSLEDFLQARGVEKMPDAQPSYQIKTNGSLPDETKVVVLEYQHT
jgi:L-ascorbate metabolism protein UlaG (beta-lactamase superfamily)